MIYSSQTVKLTDQIHSRAVELSNKYKKSEAELIDALQQVDTHKVYLEKGYSSLYQYVIQELKLSEGIAYSLITVSRKAKIVPEIKEEIKNGTMTLSNARRITAVITPENKQEWISKATTLSMRELEKEIVKVAPKLAVQEKVSYVTEQRTKLEIGLNEENLSQLKKVQDLLSQKLQKPVSLEDTIVTMTQEYLQKHDPIQKAKRVLESKKNSSLPSTPIKQNGTLPLLIARRVPIPSVVLHEVNLRDKRQCSFINNQGTRCINKRWLEVHHKVPVSMGGKNTLENLTTLCTIHHKQTHRT